MDGQIIGILQFALDGVAQQQSAVADNLSNAETPGYTAQDVSFQQSLDQALSSGGTATASITTAPSAAPASSDGNNVDFTSELVAAQQSTLQYQMLTDMVNAQLRLVQGSAGGTFS